MLDAGSSHTSLFVYQWPADKEKDTGLVSQALACQVEGQWGSALGAGLAVRLAGTPSWGRGRRGQPRLRRGAQRGSGLRKATCWEWDWAGPTSPAAPPSQASLATPAQHGLFQRGCKPRRCRGLTSRPSLQLQPSLAPNRGHQGQGACPQGHCRGKAASPSERSEAQGASLQGLSRPSTGSGAVSMGSCLRAPTQPTLLWGCSLSWGAVSGPGISSYISDPAQAGESLEGCLQEALALIPEGQRRGTPLFLGATAGMRLLRYSRRKGQGSEPWGRVGRAGRLPDTWPLVSTAQPEEQLAGRGRPRGRVWGPGPVSSGLPGSRGPGWPGGRRLCLDHGQLCPGQAGPGATGSRGWGRLARAWGGCGWQG